jgi:integrase
LSRRRHQDGQLLRLTNGWAVRLYEDFDNNGKLQRRRVQKWLGNFDKLPTQRTAQTAMLEELVLVNNHHATRPRSTLTFREQAKLWITSCEQRTWKPIKVSVLQLWRGALQNHINPILGDMPLSDVRNKAMRTLVERLTAKGTLGPSSLRTIMLVVKMVVASAVDEDGDALYPVKWNTKFIGAPSINPRKQRRPTFSADELNRLVQGTAGRIQAVVIMLAASGLRVGELLGVEVKHFDGCCLRIEQAVWNGKVQEPKTPAAHRTVELDPRVASLLCQFIGGRRTGFIFCTRAGLPISTRNLTRLLHSNLERLGIPQRGFHAFRRFRNTHLRQLRCPDGLLKFWLGHAGRDMSDRYDRSCEDLEFRRDVAKATGVGFEVPPVLACKQLKGTANRQGKKREWALTGVASSGSHAVSC